MSEFRVTFIVRKNEKVSTCWVKADSWTIEGIQNLVETIKVSQYYFEYR